ncbi:MAG: SdiA-regulated domain-containing protein [Ignavibacteriaceae bacterium]
MNFKQSVFLFLSFLLLYSCRDSSPDHPNNLLREYDFDPEIATIIKLPESLKEISGLALLRGDELLTHNDEEGIIYKFNINSGEITGQIKIGDENIKKDFEGIAAVKDSAYLVTSNGIIYKFFITHNDERADFVKFKIFLDRGNDIEGICYDAHTNALLLACKNDPGKGYKNVRAVYTFNLSKMSLERTPRFLISLEELQKKFNIMGFAPSGIEINPITNTFFIISTNPEAILEISPDGEILNALKLNKKIHKQTEGITFLKDGSLVISDEGQKKSAQIAIIKLKEKKFK